MTLTDKTQTKIHPTAIIDKGAELGTNVVIGPYSIIGAKVKIDDNCIIESHVHIKGRTTLGKGNHIWSFASIGTEPQDLKFKGEDTELICGENNLIREYVNLSIGTQGGGGKTIVGSGNLFMVGTHVAHDCIIGNDCIIANGVSLGGHVEIGNKAVLGGHAAFHQFTKIGDLAMIAGGSIVVQDVPPYCMVHGNHASPSGLNMIGLKRAGFSSENITSVKAMYRLLYSSGLTLDDAIETILREVSPSLSRNVFIEFLKKSNRGICR